MERLRARRRQCLLRVIARGRDVKDVDAVLGKQVCEANGVFESPRGLVGEDGLEAVGCRDTVYTVRMKMISK